jgi:carnitine-CoA ligase
VLDRNLLGPHALAYWSEQNPDGIAVEYINGPRLTFAEFHQECLAWASAFRRAGIGRGSHVATMLPNGFDCLRVWLGLGWVSGIEVPLNPSLRGGMLKYLLENSESTTIVIGSGYLDRLAEVAGDLPMVERVITVGTGELCQLPVDMVTAEEFLSGSVERDFEGPIYRDVAAILYTSGTTGPSKGVVTPWAMIYQMSSWVPADAVEATEALYCAMPMFHNSGKTGLNTSLVRGARFVMRDKFSATTFWDDVRATSCVSATLMGPMTALLRSQPVRPDDADNPLRSILLGPMIPEIEQFEKRFGLRVATCYAQTEIGAPLTTGWDHGPWATCGRPRTDYPWTEVRIVDANDEPVPTGSVGELIVRSPEPWSLNAGYYKMPDKTAEAWRNGWFHTGDAFRVDEAGHYYFVDRLKDSIRRRGENISSFEVENFVIEHPDVADCAAVGVPTVLGDDEVLVQVVVTDPATFDPCALIQFLAPRMPAYMIPRFVDVVDDLPRNETSMRVLKHEIRTRGLVATTWDREAADIKI